MIQPPIIRPRKLYEKMVWAFFWVLWVATSIAALAMVLWYTFRLERWSNSL